MISKLIFLIIIIFGHSFLKQEKKLQIKRMREQNLGLKEKIQKFTYLKRERQQHQKMN